MNSHFIFVDPSEFCLHPPLTQRKEANEEARNSIQDEQPVNDDDRLDLSFWSPHHRPHSEGAGESGRNRSLKPCWWGVTLVPPRQKQLPLSGEIESQHALQLAGSAARQVSKSFPPTCFWEPIKAIQSTRVCYRKNKNLEKCQPTRKWVTCSIFTP